MPHLPHIMIIRSKLSTEPVQHKYSLEWRIIMKKYIKPIPLFFLLSVALAILAAFQYDTGITSDMPGATGRTVSPMEEKDMPENEIPLPEGIHIHEFFYNPAKNTICLISRSENIFQLFSLGVDHIWVPTSCWKVSSKDDLIHFVYSTGGKLYACMRTVKDKHMTQDLVHLKKDGTVSKIPLNELEKIPKVSDKTSNTITDIRFSGTALAVTYQNSAVKFYNIEEGQALGAPSIQGEANQNIFYKYHYLSSANTNNPSSLMLMDHDIRTGEQDHTITVTSTNNHDREFWLDNYREKVWLLSSDGIFSGKYTDSCFQKILAWEELALPEIHSIQTFLCARDNVLYITYLDDHASIHLLHFDSTPPHSGTAYKNELDFSPSV